MDDGVVVRKLHVLRNGLQETVVGRLLDRRVFVVVETMETDVGLDDAPGRFEEVFVVFKTLL